MRRITGATFSSCTNGRQPWSEAGDCIVSEVEVWVRVLLPVQQPGPFRLSTGIGNHYRVGLPEADEPDEFRAKPWWALFYQRQIPVCRVVRVESVLARVCGIEEFLAIFATGPCNFQASYITWLDSGFAGTPEVQQLQKYVIGSLHRHYWVNTELYSSSQIQQYQTMYAPYQTIITGYWGAADAASWAQGMCAAWNTALSRCAWEYGHSRP